MIDAWLDLLQGGCCVGCARPGRSLCRDCRAALPRSGHPVAPDPRPPGLAPCFAAAPYDGVVRSLLLAHKERAVYGLCAPLAGCLAAALDPALPSTGRTVLVPVPSSAPVVRARGHDPLGRVARRAAAYDRGQASIEVVPLLAQVRAVADQSGLDREQRLRNRTGTMAVRGAVRDRLARRPGPVALVVVDDVLTTGATVREAQRALEVAGLRVRAVCTVAATRRRHRRPGALSAVSLPEVGRAD